MTTTAAILPASLPSPFAAFRSRDFTLIWTGQLVSTIGSSLTSLTSAILVLRLTESALSVGLMLMATAAHSLLAGLPYFASLDQSYLRDLRSLEGGPEWIQPVLHRIGALPRV